jgi:hypothetical protein
MQVTKRIASATESNRGVVDRTAAGLFDRQGGTANATNLIVGGLSTGPPTIKSVLVV